MNNESREKMQDYMVQVLLDAMKKIVNQPIDSVADQIHWHRHAVLGYRQR